MSRSMFTPARLMFVTDTAEAGAGAAEGTDTSAVDESTADGAAKDEPTSEEVDWRAKFEAQQKVTRDLERKVKGEAGTLRQQIEELTAKLNGTEKEYAEAQKAREAERAALSKADERILRAEVKAAAASKLNDPGDALRLLDLSSFEVGDDGDVDTDAIGAAIDDLIKRKPYLAAEGGRRFQGGADGGTRKDTRPSQLTRADLARMTPEQIVEADAKGRLDDLKRHP